MMACGSLIIRVPATSSVCNSAIALGYPVTLAGEQYLYILLRKGILSEGALQQTQGDDPQDLRCFPSPAHAAISSCQKYKMT